MVVPTTLKGDEEVVHLLFNVITSVGFQHNVFIIIALISLFNEESVVLG